MKRTSWHTAHRHRAFIRWQRAGMPIPNHVLDQTAFRLVFEAYRVRLKRQRIKQR